MKTKITAIIFFILFFSIELFSARLMVTSPEDDGYGSLRHIIGEARAGDTIIFDQSSRTI